MVYETIKTRVCSLTARMRDDVVGEFSIAAGVQV